MNSELSKTISTCSVWLAVACILTFGVFSTHVNGDVAIFIIFLCVPGILVFGAVVATKAIWQSGREEKTRADSAATPKPEPSFPPVVK